MGMLGVLGRKLHWRRMDVSWRWGCAARQWMTDCARLVRLTFRSRHLGTFSVEVRDAKAWDDEIGQAGRLAPAEERAFLIHTLHRPRQLGSLNIPCVTRVGHTLVIPSLQIHAYRGARSKGKCTKDARSSTRPTSRDRGQTAVTWSPHTEA